MWLASLSSTSSYSEILQSTTTLSAGDKDQLSIQSIQYHGTSCLELSVSSYKKFHYHHHFQGASENLTVHCCIWHAGASDSNSWQMALPINVFDIWQPTVLEHWRNELCITSINAIIKQQMTKSKVKKRATLHKAPNCNNSTQRRGRTEHWKNRDIGH